MDKHREHVLEAILMASERGHASLDSIQRARPDDAIREEDARTLEEEGLLVREADKVFLTPKGRTQAEDVLRRHRITEMLLSTLLGLSSDRASEIGCLVEHELQPEMVNSVCTLLGHPATCPHGSRIPAGPCCKDGRTVIESKVVPLASLVPGEQGRIVYIKPRNHQRLHRLTSLGITPGVVLELHQRQPAYCVNFEGTELAIERDVAEDIHVIRLRKGAAAK